MTGPLVGLALTLSIALGGMGWLYKREVSAHAAQVVELESLKKASKRAAERLALDRRTSAAREVAIASQARKLAEAQEALSQALQRNKAWSDTDVPTDVQKALSGRSDDPV